MYACILACVSVMCVCVCVRARARARVSVSVCLSECELKSGVFPVKQNVSDGADDGCDGLQH